MHHFFLQQGEGGWTVGARYGPHDRKAVPDLYRVGVAHKEMVIQDAHTVGEMGPQPAAQRTVPAPNRLFHNHYHTPTRFSHVPPSLASQGS